MVSVLRKKTAPSVRFKPLKAKSSANPFNRLVLIKPLIVLLCAIFAFIVYSNWHHWLENLDKSPIRAYALTHKTRFTTNADVRETLSQKPVLKGYFGQDIQQVKEKLLGISWVRDVVVRKLYPDRLSITLIEHNPVAIWNNTNFLSEQGVVFSLPADRMDKTGLPVLYGPDTEGKVVLDAWSKIKADLKARNLELQSVAVDNRGSWTITLSNHVELRLGRGEWTPKIDRFVTIFPEINVPEGQRLAYVDLRYEHGAAVGFSPVHQ
ncbi:cell division protein FtsQ/DivIB [Actinobacillus equuli]|uniref:cell division protein FtsQ/DivIB n=1 Tax=Actinobacillus equuli TaxID=718 RepID=UPI002441AF30|nr:cell division protein FtsQ/DivIB [Actinobacillus equuli]WGE64630.1 cell division protein FtsQ/DivIB [Actinobacillus equuli subsp. equuli]WGE78591.1 cell division protein FtsQ/DivIB [Actinobacillus equuli subsp. equuli]